MAQLEFTAALIPTRPLPYFFISSPNLRSDALRQHASAERNLTVPDNLSALRTHRASSFRSLEIISTTCALHPRNTNILFIPAAGTAARNSYDCLSSVGTSAASRSGIDLAPTIVMKFFCRHCDEIVVGKPYRVLSEEEGVTLLDMTVCRSCYKQARALGLNSTALPLDPKPRRNHRSSAYAPDMRGWR
jgi:RNase P subunit RPR2